MPFKSTYLAGFWPLPKYTFWLHYFKGELILKHGMPTRNPFQQQLRVNVPAVHVSTVTGSSCSMSETNLPVRLNTQTHTTKATSKSTTADVSKMSKGARHLFNLKQPGREEELV